MLKRGIILIILILNISLVFAISNVEHDLDGNKLTITYEGTPPFYINIRRDQNIDQPGGYVWAKTFLKSFTIDLSFANNPFKLFYYGVKDKTWSDTKKIDLIEDWKNICNNGKNYEITSTNRIYSSKSRKPTSYIIPGSSINLGIKNINTGETKYDLNYNYETTKPLLVDINGNSAQDITPSYDDYDMFIDISIPELQQCQNIKQPMRVIVGDPFLGENIAFVYPKTIIPAEVLNPNQNWATISVEQMMENYDFVRITDIVYNLQKELFGTAPLDNDALLMALMPSWCGGAGQPTGFGVGCLIQPSNEPHWGVVFHEIGHVFTGHFLLEWSDGIEGSYPSNRYIFAEFADCCGLLYTEGIATLAALYAENRMIEEAALYGIEGGIYDGIYNQFSNDNTNYLNDLNNYETQGNNFNDINPNILDGIFIYLANEQNLNLYGWEVYPRFFKIYLDPLPQFVTSPLTEIQGHTYFIAGLSAATDSDLRPLFREWNFPIDETYYNQIYPILANILAQ